MATPDVAPLVALVPPDPFNDVLHAAHDHWSKTVFLEASNLPLLIPAVTLVRLIVHERASGKRPPSGLYVALVMTWIAMVASLLYHLCQSASVCALHTFQLQHLSDHIYANYLPVLYLFLWIDPYPMGWILMMHNVFFFVVVLMELAFPFSSVVLIFGVLYTIGAFVLYVLFGPESTLDRIVARTHPPSLVAASIFVIGGRVFYEFDGNGGPYYWLFHSLWHICVSLGLSMFLLAITRDLAGWMNGLELAFYIVKFQWIVPFFSHSFELLTHRYDSFGEKKNQLSLLAFGLPE